MPRRVGVTSYSEQFSGGDIAADEWEFLRAVAAYQKRWGRRYPSWREVLFVARCLGYRKVAPPTDPTRVPTAAEKRLAEAADRAANYQAPTDPNPTDPDPPA